MRQAKLVMNIRARLAPSSLCSYTWATEKRKEYRWDTMQGAEERPMLEISLWDHIKREVITERCVVSDAIAEYRKLVQIVE